MVDVAFRFEKFGYETVEQIVTVHEKGQLFPFFPNRVWFDSPFEVTLQGSDGEAIEGVKVYQDGALQGQTDMNGRITLFIAAP